MRGLRIPVKEETRWSANGAPPTPRIKAYVFARDAYTCRYCGISGEGVVLEADHVIPNRLHGPDVCWNLVTACRPCNRSKSGHALDCWMEQRACARGRYGQIQCQ